MREEELHANEIDFNSIIDLKSRKTISYSKNGMTDETELVDISLSIANKLDTVFKNFGSDKVDEIEKALNFDKLDEAIKLLLEGKRNGLFFFCPPQICLRLFNIINKVPVSTLEPLERKDLYELKFSLSGSTGCFADLFEDVDKYLAEFGNIVSTGLKSNLIIIKANSASQQGKVELAYNLYNQVLVETGNDYGASAWAHRGLAITLGYDNPDGIYHESKAADAFLLNGDKKMYASCKALLAENIKLYDLQKAIELLDDAISVFDKNELTEKDEIAALYLNKALIYNMWNDNQAALHEVVDAIKLLETPGVIGNEAQKIAQLNAAILFSELEDGDEEQQVILDGYKEKIDKLEMSMLESEKTSYTIKKRIINAIHEKSISTLEEMEKEVLAENNLEIKALYQVSLVLIDTNIEFTRKIELLETTWLSVNQITVSNDIKSVVCSLFAELYKERKNEDKALEWYKKALEFNPFTWANRQNYVALLWKNNKWKDSVIFFEDQINRFGELPSLLFAYGKSLVEAGRPSEAISFLGKSQIKTPDAKYINEYLLRAIEQSNKGIPCNYTFVEIPDDVTIETFERCLNDFCEFIKNDKRMSFWKYNDEKKQHSWVSSPEKHGQNLLHTFIKSRFVDNIEIMEEVSTGAGRMDIYLHFKNGFKTIVELKMCGNRYSVNYAKEGFEQLEHYMENKSVRLGYLIIFDGRKRDFGKGIEKSYSFEQYIFRSYVVDVTPKIKD